MYKFLPMPQTLLQNIPSDPSPMNRLLPKLLQFNSLPFTVQIPSNTTASLRLNRSFQYHSQSSTGQIPPILQPVFHSTANLPLHRFSPVSQPVCPLDRFLPYFSKSSTPQPSLLLHKFLLVPQQIFSCTDSFQNYKQVLQIPSKTSGSLHLYRFLPILQQVLHCRDSFQCYSKSSTDSFQYYSKFSTVQIPSNTTASPPLYSTDSFQYSIRQAVFHCTPSNTSQSVLH